MGFDRKDGGLALAVFVVALAVNLAAVPTTEFHRDEARWIHRARFVAALRDPTGPYWESRELMWGQPPLGSYVTGLGLLAQGRDLVTNELYNFHYGEAWNRRNGAMPDERDLEAARRTNSVIGALIAVCAYAIARSLTNRVGGVAAALMLVPHPLSVYLSSLAGSDALLTLCVALATLVAMWLAGRPTWAKAVLLGVLLGLGASTKLTPLLIAPPLAALGVVLLLRARRSPAADQPRVATLGWTLLPLPAVAFATFVLSYPYLWPDPIGRTIVLVQFRAKEMANQGAIWDHLYVAGPLDALTRIGFWFGLVDSTTGRFASLVAWFLGFEWHPPGIDLPLAIAGAVVFGVLVVRNGLASRHALAAGVLGTETALVVLGMRADFARYLLPVLLAQVVCIGVLAGTVWAALGARRGRRPVLAPAAALTSVGAPVGAGSRPMEGVAAGGPAPTPRIGR